MQYFKLLTFLICLFIISVAEAAQSEAELKVMAFVTAFNEQDVDAMLSLATENVVWMSVTGESIAVEAKGSGNLKAAMQDYFTGHPGSYSKIKQIQSSGTWVTTLEHAGRKIDGEFKGRCAYAMYQLNDGMIESVWYFSSHKCDDSV